MSERIAVGAIAYGSTLVANAAGQQFAASLRLSRSRARLAAARAELAAAQERYRRAEAINGRR